LSAIRAEIQGGFQIFFNDDIDAFAGLRLSLRRKMERSLTVFVFYVNPSSTVVFCF